MTVVETVAPATGEALTADGISYRIDRLPFLPFHWRIAGILGTGTLFDGFDSLSIGAALTMIIATFKIDYKTGGALISAAFAGQFVGALAVGYSGERIGRKWSFVAATAIFGLCSAAAALAQSVDQILVARVIQGVGLGAEVPVAAALFTEFVRGSRRGLFILIYESMFAWGIFFGPVVALTFLTLFGPELGWRAIFALGGVPAIVSLVAVFKLPESARWLASKGRLAEANAIVTRMEDEARRLGRPALPTEPITVIREKTRLTELFRGIYAKRTFVVWSQWFCCYFVSNGYVTWAPTLYMKMGGLPAKYALLVTIVTGAIQLASTYVFAVSVDHYGRKPWFTGGFLFAAAGALVGALAMGPFEVRGWFPLAFFGLLLALGTSPSTLGVYLYTPELYPTRMRAWATATGSSMNRVASFIAPSITGFILAEFNSVAMVFAMMAGVAIVGASIMWFFGEETKRRVLEELSP
ncbi:MAG TPA: MFS transporter [Stellaceae bacterium]|nr:MFS transporter [Stellaceae bacterium]